MNTKMINKIHIYQTKKTEWMISVQRKKKKKGEKEKEKEKRVEEEEEISWKIKIYNKVERSENKKKTEKYKRK